KQSEIETELTQNPCLDNDKEQVKRQEKIQVLVNDVLQLKDKYRTDKSASAKDRSLDKVNGPVIGPGLPLAKLESIHTTSMMMMMLDEGVIEHMGEKDEPIGDEFWWLGMLHSTAECKQTLRPLLSGLKARFDDELDDQPQIRSSF
ncbi:hypothetical protein RFI_34981, partial [Reticulomyxa filosa]